MNNIIIQYTLSKEEFVGALIYHNSLQFKKRLLAYILVFLISVGYILAFDLNFFYIIPAFLIYVVMYIFFSYIAKHKFKKCYIESTIHNAEKKVVFTDNNFSIMSNEFNTSINYSLVKKWHKNDTFLLLYLSGNAFHIFPLRVFDTMKEVDTILAWIKQDIK